MNKNNKDRFIFAGCRIGEVKQYEIGIIDDEKDRFSVNFAVNNRKLRVDKNQVQLFEPLETGDSYLKKVCNVCHRYLDTISFQKNQNGKGDRPIRRPSCNDCRKLNG